MAGKSEPANVKEILDWAWFCQLPRLHHYAAATRLYAKAFAAEPLIASDPRNTQLHRAARSAAKAGTGADTSGSPLSEAERARLRAQALDWLRSELAIWSQAAQSKRATDERVVRRMLRQWQLEPDLAGVRDPAALAKLPESERKGWQDFWQEVQRMLSTPPLGGTVP